MFTVRYLPHNSETAETIGEASTYNEAKAIAKARVRQSGEVGMMDWVTSRYGIVHPNGDFTQLGW